MKKTYVTPVMEILILEQSDIITASSVPTNGKGNNATGTYEGTWDTWS